MADIQCAEAARPVVVAACEVAFNRPVNDFYLHMAVEAPAAALAAQPGQFFHLLCPGQGQGDHMLRRPMSLYGVDQANGRVEFLYKVLGAGTQGLATLAPGDKLEVFGPLGHGFRLDPSWRHIILLGRGVGLATLAPLAAGAGELGIKVTAILSAATPARLMSVERLRGVGAEVITVTDADGDAAPARVEALLRRLAAQHGCDMIATCGSSRLLRLVQRLGRELGVEGQVALEQHMACGIGTCFCCVRPFQVGDRVEIRKVCLDGPVFDVQEVPA